MENLNKSKINRIKYKIPCTYHSASITNICSSCLICVLIFTICPHTLLLFIGVFRRYSQYEVKYSTLSTMILTNEYTTQNISIYPVSSCRPNFPAQVNPKRATVLTFFTLVCQFQNFIIINNIFTLLCLLSFAQDNILKIFFKIKKTRPKYTQQKRWKAFILHILSINQLRNRRKCQSDHP